MRLLEIIQGMKQISLLKLYLIFVKIGAILLGGGYVILPILTDEICKKKGLLDESDLVDYFAISQSLPGIVAANISMFTGYKLRGKFGALAAVLGVITVPFIVIILLASLFNSLADNQYVDKIFWGVGVAIIALIILTIREIWQKTEKGLFFYLIFSIALISMVCFKLSPVSVVILFSFLGVLIKIILAGRSK